ncbi:superinfection immunity protein [Terriglobus sp.]|uniref:superinfection immunity protein n=1 Tax=Terriglobus sp. TaxID=1889013 RepID=UPI003AFF7E73
MFSSIFLAVFAILGIALGLALYFLPTIIAQQKRHRSLGGIFVLNLLLGWSLLGWIGALVWALSNPAPVVIVQNVPGYPPQAYGGAYPPQPGYPPQQGYAPQPGYAQQPGYPQQPVYPPAALPVDASSANYPPGTTTYSQQAASDVAAPIAAPSTGPHHP